MDTAVISENITCDVLMKYGMKRELAGRIGRIAVLEKLDKEKLKRILTEPTDSLTDRYAREIKLSSGAELIIDEKVLDEIVDRAEPLNIGARGLDITFRKIMSGILYDAPDNKGANEVRLILDNDEIKAVWRKNNEDEETDRNK